MRRASSLLLLALWVASSSAQQANPQPLPDTVLRRLEASEGAFEAFRPQEALVISSLSEALHTLARQTEDSNRALRRDLEELRAATLRESDIAVKTTYLMLVALAALVGQLLPTLWSREGGSQDRS